MKDRPLTRPNHNGCSQSRAEARPNPNSSQNCANTRADSEANRNSNCHSQVSQQQPFRIKVRA